MKHRAPSSMLLIGLLSAVFAAAHPVLAQPIIQSTEASPPDSYADVAVVINGNSAASREIAAYFAAVRNIPSRNLLWISVPEREEITDAEFAMLRSQLEGTLTLRGLTDRINYIVTTKGVPLKIKRQEVNASASVESELALILGRYAGYIGMHGRVLSPYYGASGAFSRASYDVYLVTRLDGFTVADVIRLIDRAGAQPSSIPEGARFVFDQAPEWDTLAGRLNENMKTAATRLESMHQSVTLETTAAYLKHQTSVIGYASWGSSDLHSRLDGSRARQYNSYLAGAIAELYTPHGAGSFNAPPENDRSAVADMIADGITGVKGYVYEPFASSMSDAQIVFPAYANGSTLAESFFAASPYLSWMDVVIGDPKCRITIAPRAPGLSSQPAATPGAELAYYPNPFNPSARISFAVKESGHASLTVYNMLGQELAVLFDSAVQAREMYAVTFDASSLPSGIYFTVLRAGAHRLVRKMVLAK